MHLQCGQSETLGRGHEGGNRFQVGYTWAMNFCLGMGEAGFLGHKVREAVHMLRIREARQVHPPCHFGRDHAFNLVEVSGDLQYSDVWTQMRRGMAFFGVGWAPHISLIARDQCHQHNFSFLV